METEVKIAPLVSRVVVGTARLAEIKSIVKTLEESEHGRRAYQTLPRHMQRKQCSGNPKRLPSYIREQHKREGGSNAKVTRRPSRKYRRRPRNLLEEYNRRQKTHVWLETHIWHAKRFHMIKRWGYSLPDCPTFKGYRASIKASKTTCLVQDVSFLCCIELEGSIAALLSGLSRITQPCDIASLTESKVQEGKEWASVTFFTPDKQPHGAVGDVDILWLPSDESVPGIIPTSSKLWIWIHPSAHNHVVEALTIIFELGKVKNVSDTETHLEVSNQEDIAVSDVKVNSDEQACVTVLGSTTKSVVISLDNDSSLYGELSSKVIEEDSKKRKNESQDSGRNKKHPKYVNETKLATKNIPFERTPKYYSNSSGIKMTLLKDTLCRFRLTGPKSIDVLKAAFIPASLDSIKGMDDGQMNVDEKANTPWWKDYYCDENRLGWHQSQVNLWNNFSSTHPDKKIVLPITVRDPRVTLPGKKSPIPTSKDTKGKDSFSSFAIGSPLYYSEIRDKIALSKEPDYKINECRSQLLVPGYKLPETSHESKVPLVLLSRPCTHATGYGAGWDVLFSSGWGMNVWLPIVLSGGVAGGQQAAENLHMEFLTPLPPHLLPDTPAGDYYSKVLSEERKREFFKRPPSCRHNFIKLGVQYPFKSPWLKLVQDWVQGAQDFCVIRNPAHLTSLASKYGDARIAVKRINVSSGLKISTFLDNIPVQTMDFITSPTNVASLQDCNSEKFKYKEPLEKSSLYKPENALMQSKACLVTVKVILEGRGNLEPCAMICLPLKTDIEERSKERSSFKDARNITEQDHMDTHHEQRKLLKAEHEQVKKKIRRLNKKAKQRVEATLAKPGVVHSGDSSKTLYQDALSTVMKENQDIFAKHLSYNSEMENLWFIRSDAPLQCCSRKIIGYLTHGCFSMTLGRGAGIGWIAVKPLFDCIQLYEELKDKDFHAASSSLKNENWKADQRISVLVRNPSCMQYYWATLVIVR